MQADADAVNALRITVSHLTEPARLVVTGAVYFGLEWHDLVTWSTLETDASRDLVVAEVTTIVDAWLTAGANAVITHQTRLV